MPSQKRQFGDLGEKTAVKYLENKGYEIIETNYRNRFGPMLGEIDIIAKDKGEIVFVEVKTREMHKYEHTLPEENITRGKLRKMAKIANAYLRQNGYFKEDYRFDAISVWLDMDEKRAKVKHIDHL